MGQFIICRDYIDSQCTVFIGAEDTEELIEAAVEHAHIAHAEEDTPALRAYIKQSIRHTSQPVHVGTI